MPRVLLLDFIIGNWDDIEWHRVDDYDDDNVNMPSSIMGNIFCESILFLEVKKVMPLKFILLKENDIIFGKFGLK